MKKIFFIITILAITTNAQFKNDPKENIDVRKGIVTNPNSSFVMGFINPENFSMRHSFSMSYSAFGSQSVALGVYTNHMAYQFNESLNIELDASIINSPYNSFGNDFSNQLNGFYLSRAQLNYQPSDKFSISVQYMNTPMGYYDYPSYYNYYGRQNYRIRNTANQ